MYQALNQTGPARGPRAISRWTLRLDGILLLAAGLGALIADLAGYLFGRGPFAGLAGQPLAVGAVEAHGLAALLGLLMLRGAGSGELWGWHAVAFGVHLFLASCNLLFWEVYALMGATSAGIVSTIAHAALAAAQLACLAGAAPERPGQLPPWLRRWRQSGLFVRPIAICTLLLGGGAHIAVILLGRAALPQILSPAFELLLTVPMAYVSVAGWLAWPYYLFHGRWHQVALGLILVYFPIGLPFHLITITTGSTAHYTVLPAWYSLFIVPVMMGIAACFAGLRLRDHASTSAGPGDRHPS